MQLCLTRTKPHYPWTSNADLLNSTSPERKVESDAEEEEEEELLPQTAPKKQKPLRNGAVRNQEVAPVNNLPQPPQQQQQQVAQPQHDYQRRPEPHHVSQRAEGYRTSAIRESRIKDRPVTSHGASESALKIKIELDLEVEVDLYARVKGDVTIGLM